MINPIDQPSTSQEQSTQHQFFHSIGIGSGGVENGNTELGHTGDGDVVGSGTAASDGSDGDVNFGFLEFVRAEEDGVGVVFGVIFGYFVVGGGEAC